MHNEDVNCKKCGKHLAWWDMFTNIQYENEYQCSAIVTYHSDGRRKHPDNLLIMDNVIPFNDEKSDEIKRLTTDVWGVKTMRGKKMLKDNWSYCEIVNHTAFCEECTKKFN